MMQTTRLVAVIVLMFQVAMADAAVVVAVSRNSSMMNLSKSEVVHIFMGRYRHFPDGSEAHPLDREDGSVVRAKFYRTLLGKTIDEVNAYWAYLRFSGRILPPMVVEGKTAYLKSLSNDSHAIGYMDDTDLSPALRVVFELPE